MQVIKAAESVHTIFKQTCEAFGLEYLTIPAWENASDASKIQAVYTVKRIMLYPDVTPRECQTLYLQWSLANGWKPGEKYNDILKTNPRLKAWHWLTSEEKKISEVIVKIGKLLRFPIIEAL